MLKTEICGLTLKNPTVLASGILGNVGSSLLRCARAGAGALVTKSIGKHERQGHKNPTVIRIQEGYLNAVGLANQGIAEFGDEVASAKEGGVPVIGSIFGFSVREFVSVATTMEDYGVDAIELNLSCPNVGKAGAFFGTSEELTYEVVKAVKDSVNVPVIAKLTANTGDLVAIAKACERAECDAVTAINTLKAMKIDLKAKMPILGHKIGGLSGPCIKPIGVASVYEIVKETGLPVMGCGGVTTGEDAVEYLMAGASAVQIGVGVADRGISIFKKVSREIEGFMVENSYKSLKDLIGIAQG
jgi:dihydroorotate dehydrogenase (NAD+) catalytic subunit